MRRGVILQERDFEILRTLYESSVISFSQVKDRHFRTTNIQTASNRMGRLSKGGFLKSYRLGLVIYQGVPRQVSRVYSIATLGIQALASRFPNSVQRFDPVPLQSYSLVHDLLLNDVHEKLREENQGRRLVNTKNLKIIPSRMDQIPDLVMEGENGELCHAVELELSMKSSRRYREIVTNYRLSSRWKRVLFICAGDSIESKIRSTLSGPSSVRGTDDGPVGKFNFRKLSELLPTSNPPSLNAPSYPELETA